MIWAEERDRRGPWRVSVSWHHLAGFPTGFMTPKVGPHRTFGFAPGTIFGHATDLIFRQGMMHCDNGDMEIGGSN